MSYIVTGGCGFIGSNFVNFLADVVDDEIIVFDNFTYASDSDNVTDNDKVRIVDCDINNTKLVHNFLSHVKPKAIFHFAAESHVDNSITDPGIFVHTNTVGTMCLLQGVKEHSTDTRFVHISTDEVYGALDHDGSSFLESKVLEPNNVYSASKAGADLLVRAYHKTYGLDVVTTRCCNNYGPRQHTEKLLPKVISNAINDVSIPVYGEGDNVREWIFVEDHCKCIYEIFKLGKSGEIYNIGSGVETSNLDIVKKILSKMSKPFSLIKFVKDRPGHDFRYSIDSSKINNLMGNTFSYKDIDKGLDETIRWYKEIFPEA
jgi:dTDP-glucose 4,6-dehydratase